MAITSIWAVKGWLGSIILYTENPAKTTKPVSFGDGEYSDVELQGLSDVIKYAARDDATAMRQLVTGINCEADTARDEMMAVKAHYGKTEGIVAYHGYQSFKPGEVTPDQAHQIGVELAKQLWGERFQIVVATHIDCSHIHSHFVVNSVSFADGKKYHRTKADYWQMRQTSDAICREHGLSVIEPQAEGRKKEAANRTNQTWRQSIKADVDEAIRGSYHDEQIVGKLQALGYKVVWQYNLTIRPVGRKNFIHVDAVLGYEYSTDNIMWQLSHNRDNRLTLSLSKYFRLSAEADILSGLVRLAGESLLGVMQFTCYMLALHSKAPAIRNIHPAIRKDVKQLESYVAQVRMMERYNAKTPEQVQILSETLEQRIAALGQTRKPLYRQASAKDQIANINKDIKKCRAELKLCKSILELRLPDKRLLLDITGKSKSRSQSRSARER